MKSTPLSRRGLTLLEVLAVITIISALLAVVMPVLNSAWRTSRQVICMNTLSKIAEGAVVYGKNFDDWIVGSPWGSGNYLRSQSSAWGPAVQTWDFFGPLEDQWSMGLIQPVKGDPDSAVARRFNDLRACRAFFCAGNQFTATYYPPGLDAGAGPMVSYNTCRNQLYPAAQAPSMPGISLPNDWRPSISRIGNPARKAFCADGARYSTCVEPPDYDLTCDAGAYGGAFSDAGPYSAWSRSWDRCRTPGNQASPGGHLFTGMDPRCYAFRHSAAEPPVGAPANAYRLNVAFYDGHVENQGDLEASNPHQWLPKGTRVEGASELWPDAAAIYGTSDILIAD